MTKKWLFIVMYRHQDWLYPVFISFSIAAQTQVANQLRPEPLHSDQLQLSPHRHWEEKKMMMFHKRGAVMNWTWLRWWAGQRLADEPLVSYNEFYWHGWPSGISGANRQTTVRSHIGRWRATAVAAVASSGRTRPEWESDFSKLVSSGSVSSPRCWH